MNRTQEIINIVKKKGIIRASDCKKSGISRNYLYKLGKAGILLKISRGLYTLTDIPSTEYLTLIEVAKRTANAVFCLLTALSFHRITTQIPHEVWISIPRGSWRPNIEYPSLNISILSKDAYSFAIQEHKIKGIIIKVYSPAKTIADCFKFRNKVGLDVAIEALKETLRSKKATIDEIMRAAQINRVTKIMRPYLEAIA
ncbi:MAG: type IV toxin-antitoxin system AbiEi family antitoxin domain-containing protein [Lentisphaerota bacterium]